MLGPNEVLIGDHNFHQYQPPPTVDGEVKSYGLIPRDYKTHPRGCYSSIHAIDVPLIDQGEWPQRLKDLAANHALLSDIRLKGNAGQPIPSRDQNGKGYCWAHSGTSATLIVRATANLPYADLSAYAVACTIKSYRDEGGWGAQGVDFMADKGIPTSATWPQQSMSRSNDNAATWADAAKHKITEGFIDLAAAQYDRNLSFNQVASLLLSGVPVVVDYNWWSHSVCAIDLVDGAAQRGVYRDLTTGKIPQLSAFDQEWGMSDPVTAGFGVRIWNSWGDSWSDRGMGTLSGSKAIPDGAVAPRQSTPS